MRSALLLALLGVACAPGPPPSEQDEPDPWGGAVEMRLGDEVVAVERYAIVHTPEGYLMHVRFELSDSGAEALTGDLVFDARWSPMEGSWSGFDGRRTSIRFGRDAEGAWLEETLESDQRARLERAFGPVDMLLGGPPLAANIALCFIASDRPQTRHFFPGVPFEVRAREPTGLRTSAGHPVERLALPDRRGGWAHSLLCAGRSLVAAPDVVLPSVAVGEGAVLEVWQRTKPTPGREPER